MKRMAIMKRVGFGVRDTNRCCLFFDAYEPEGLVSLQIVPAEKAIEVLEKHYVHDVKHLEGKPCWVESDEHSGTSRFIDLVKLP